MGRAFEFRKERKFKRWGNMARVFTKLGKEITISVKQAGPLPENNPRLRLLMQTARKENMPKDNVERAIKKGAGGSDSDNYESIIYEGYGPGGVAIIVETLTDNKNRTAGNVRYYFDKNGGNMGTSGCVSFMFDRKGEIIIEKTDDISEDELMETALENNAQDFITEDDCFVIYTDTADFSAVKEALGSKYEFISADIKLIPETYTNIDESNEKLMEKLLDQLEDDDDIQNVFHNIKQ